LVVSDTGVGIAAERAAVVFDTFKQADNSLTRRYQGLGLGLSIARELVNMLGGSLGIESKVGVGTTVTVRVPRKLEGHGQRRTARQGTAIRGPSEPCAAELLQEG
jgi:signal transduction histidine kinase